MCPHGVGMIAEPADTPLAFADQLRAALSSALRIELVGVGEPLLSPFFRRIVDERTFRPEAYVRTTTNGQLLTPETRTWLLASDLKEVSVSFDAATAATYEYIRGGDFARLVRNVAALASERRRCGRAAAPEIWINFTIMQANAAECEAFVRAAAALDAYGVEFSLLNGYGDHSDWVVRRGDCVFRYHDNMADRDLPTVRHHLTRALEEGGRLGLPVRLRMLAEEREKLNLHQEGYC